MSPFKWLSTTKHVILPQRLAWLFNPSLEESSNLPGKYPTLDLASLEYGVIALWCIQLLALTIAVAYCMWFLFSRRVVLAVFPTKLAPSLLIYSHLETILWLLLLCTFTAGPAELLLLQQQHVIPDMYNVNTCQANQGKLRCDQGMCKMPFHFLNRIVCCCRFQDLQIKTISVEVVQSLYEYNFRFLVTFPV